MDEAVFYTIRQIAEMLGISYNAAYELVASGPFPSSGYKRRRKVSKLDFDAWYQGQSKFKKLEELSSEEKKHRFRKLAIREMPRLSVNTEKTVYSVNELMILLDASMKEIREMVRSGVIPSFMADHKYQIRREFIMGWLVEQQLALEEAEENGIHQAKGE